MKNLFLLSFIALVFSLTFYQVSHAVCTNGGTTAGNGNILNCPAPIQNVRVLGNGALGSNDATGNPDEINIPLNGGVDVSGANAVNTGNGADIVDTSGNIITDTGKALNTQGGNDMVIVRDGLISSSDNGNTDDGINTASNNDHVQVFGGTITSGSARGISTENGNDLLEIMGGEISGGIRPIQMGPGNDTLRIYGGIINGGNANGDIAMDAGDDTVLLAGGTFNNVTLRMGNDDNDMVNFAADIDLDLVDCATTSGMGTGTLMFSMNVAQQFVQDVTDAINNADPDDGSVVINGITYTWLNCQSLIANLNAVLTTITLTPISSTDEINTDHTVTATVETDDAPGALAVRAATPGVLVNFEVTSGPNAGEMSDPGTGECNPDNCETDANGQVNWTYSSEVPGVDNIVASFDDPILGSMNSNTVEEIWVIPPKNVPTLSQWGLIAMAGALGIIGFMVIRRRQLIA